MILTKWIILAFRKIITKMYQHTKINDGFTGIYPGIFVKNIKYTNIQKLSYLFVKCKIYHKHIYHVKQYKSLFFLEIIMSTVNTK